MLFNSKENLLSLTTFHGVVITFTMTDNCDVDCFCIDGDEFENPYSDTWDGVYVLVDDKIRTIAELRNQASSDYEVMLREEAIERSYDRLNDDCMI